MKQNRPPSDGLQFFGTLTINARTLVARLHNLSGKAIYSVELEAR
jgi:alkaline phosphatase D